MIWPDVDWINFDWKNHLGSLQTQDFSITEVKVCESECLKIKCQFENKNKNPQMKFLLILVIESGTALQSMLIPKEQGYYF